jgi:hypothetical protein
VPKTPFIPFEAIKNYFLEFFPPIFSGIYRKAGRDWLCYLFNKENALFPFPRVQQCMHNEHIFIWNIGGKYCGEFKSFDFTEIKIIIIKYIF